MKVYSTSEFVNLLNKKDPNHWCVFYLPGMRGNALVRILASHKESWWDNQTMNINVDDAISDPLEFSENQSGFKLEYPYKNLSSLYLAPHTNVNVDFFCSHGYMNEMSKMKQTLEKRNTNSNKYFFTCAHPDKNFDVERYVYIFASKQNSKRTYIGSTPKNSENVFNIDISKLFSPKRGEFDQEYAKIVNFFNFTPRFSSVRNFILQLLDREKSWDSKASLYDGLRYFNW